MAWPEPHDLHSTAKIKSRVESCGAWHGLIFAEIQKPAFSATEGLKRLRAPEFSFKPIAPNEQTKKSKIEGLNQSALTSHRQGEIRLC